LFFKGISMATSNKRGRTQGPPVTKSAKAKSSTPRRRGAAVDNLLQTNDASAEQGLAVNEMVAAIPFNAEKEFEYGLDNSRAPREGASVEASDPALTASTSSEDIVNAKTGGAASHGTNPTNDSLERMRVDGGGQVLTTNQGVAVADNQSSLKAGLRGPALLEDFVLRAARRLTAFSSPIPNSAI
jgi:catalase